MGRGPPSGGGGGGARTRPRSLQSNHLSRLPSPSRPLPPPLFSLLNPSPSKRYQKKKTNNVRIKRGAAHTPSPPPATRKKNGRAVQPANGGGGLPRLQGPPRWPRPRAHRRYAPPPPPPQPEVFLDADRFEIFFLCCYVSGEFFFWFFFLGL